MPWQEVSTMDQRQEFVRLALLPGANMRELCRRFGISPETGYKWRRRWLEGDQALTDRSRRPLSSPKRTAEAVEASVLAVRDAHPAWGPRKIARCLEREGVSPPAISTIHAVLARHRRIAPGGNGTGGKPWQRFEMDSPNQLWQMDFKGYQRLGNGRLCHPLTVVDDHSRYALCLKACADQKSETVQDHLTTTFRRHGLPDALFVDNGSPWSDSGGHPWTKLGVWLLKHGVGVIRSRPYHPQSRGKIERFHRSLQAEVFNLRRLRDLADAETAFDRWRHVYNTDRPHEALGQEVPLSRYRPSPRAMPDVPPEPQYDDGEILRRVGPTKSYVSFKGQLWGIPKAFCGETVAIRPTATDGRFDICFGAHRIGTIDLTAPEPVSHVSEQVSTMSPG